MTIPKEHPQYETKRRNIAIALFLGWFKENGQPDTWYEILNNTAQYVAYSEYSDPYKSLPFNRDWAWLMKAVEKVEDIMDGIYVTRVCMDRGRCVIKLKDKELFSASTTELGIATKIDATFIAVSDFCIAWCEKNKPNELEKYLTQ